MKNHIAHLKALRLRLSKLKELEQKQAENQKIINLIKGVLK